MAMDIKELWVKPSLLYVIFSACLYLLVISFYRLHLSPLAKFPGPKLAALTYCVEFYYDVVKRGQYTFEITKLHKRYGPIIRISPSQIHINDRDFLDELYPGSNKPTDKDPAVSGAFGNSKSILTTVQHDLHRLRRSVLNPFFSKRAIVEHVSMIEAAVEKLCCRLKEFQASQEPLDLRVAFAALSADIISMYSYGRSYNCLDKPDLDPHLYNNIASGGELGLFLRHYPWIFPIANSMPYWLTVWLNPKISTMLDRRAEIERQVRTIIDTNASSVEPVKSPTIFHKLINSPLLPPSERSMPRLIDEGITLIGAGTVTTAHVLSTTVYHILANPPILYTLRAELKDAALPGDPSTSAAKPPLPLTQLERLPYLTATIKEGLRLSHAISHRNARIAQGRELQYRTWKIPPGTSVSMTGYILHTDPAIFPEPNEFRPERWMRQNRGDGGSGGLDKYLIPFGRGSRICLGMNLAYAELYLGLAAVVARFEMKLYQTGREDVDLAHDFVAGSARVGSKGIRVVVLGSDLEQN